MLHSMLRFIRHPVVLATCGLLFIILLITGYLFRSQLLNLLNLNRDRPTQRFSETTPPPAPNYADKNSWLALPNIADPSDFVPAGLNDLPNDPQADVFWVHPTIYIPGNSWNQSVDPSDMHDHLSTQASIFNECCAVYAPRYRQANIYAFYELENDGGKAIELAYQDVADAFSYYLEHYNQGRPFILAGHSQGSHLLERLIHKNIRGQAVEEQLVAAYLAGHDIEPDMLDGLPVCDSPVQTRCQIVWNTVSSEIDVSDHSPTLICVNPLTWRTDGERGDFSDNLGAFYLLPSGEYKLEKEITDAQCIDGHLRVSEVQSSEYLELLQDGYYHTQDYSMFYVNIRKNATMRVDAFLQGEIRE